ncbi:fatty acid desaturase [Aliiroseovarius marinus]|uniref:fatty acid desaturase n=1 Tax=Aliiroseovarius marinus TaxID=2500159 RepID=UPI003D7E1A9C
MKFEKRDYTLTVLNGQRPKPVKWWVPDIAPEKLVALRTANNRHALIDFGLWFVLLGLTGWMAWISLGSPWAIPMFFIYGTIYASSDARWHELSHGTVFRTKWLNDSLYQLCSFMTLREAYLWRYSHTRHHTHTIVVGSDPEIQVARPADLVRIALDFFFIPSGIGEIRRITSHAFRGLSAQEAQFVPERAKMRLIRNSRIYVLLWVLIVLWCVIGQSLLPLLFVIGPRFYGGWLHQLLGLTQHAGLAENVTDHRENCRTVMINPVFRYLYMNMNYHLEHHASPTVPYHTLPNFHALIADQCPPAYPSLWAAYREIMPVLWAQATKDPDIHASRPVPKAAVQA